MTELGARMKRNYELPARRSLTRKVPVIIRVDGKAFHTFTGGLTKPFSSRLMDAMSAAATKAARQMQGFQAAYIQSDEMSFLLTDYAKHESEPWLGYVQNKLESIVASIVTAEFNSCSGMDSKLAVFDARAFNVPREDVANYFLWRAKDWHRNSVMMYASSCYSPTELHGKGRADQHELLHAKGKNWTTDLTDQERNGTFVVWKNDVNGRLLTARYDILPEYPAIAKLLDPAINPEPVPA